LKKRNYTEFGVRVVKWMIDNNLKGTDLERTLGMPERYLNKILHGNRAGKKYRAQIERMMNGETDD
jgi:DNA-binding Xre family transcriptional regulator